MGSHVSEQRDQRVPLNREGIFTTWLLLAILAATAWLSTIYDYRADWTATRRNTLSEVSRELLQSIEQPIVITAYARHDIVVRRAVEELVDRYRRASENVAFSFVDPDKNPARARQLGLTANGELVVELGTRREVVRTLSEQALTNALRRLALRGERWVAFITGHGERDLLGAANHDLGRFARVLREGGYSIRPINLARAGTIPDNTALLIVSRPSVAWLAHETALVLAFLESGGNLLWLDDPGGVQHLGELGLALGVQALPGTVIDSTSRYPEVAIVSEPGDHPMLEGFDLNTLFPMSTAYRWSAPSGWRARGILSTADKSWLETGPLDGSIRFDTDVDQRGPLSLGVVLQRRPGATRLGEASTEEQRVIVVGDGDFLSNAYLGNGGNLELGLKMVNWLSNQDSLISLPALSAPDLRFEPGPGGRAVIALGPPVAVPLGVLLAGTILRRRRRRRSEAAAGDGPA